MPIKFELSKLTSRKVRSDIGKRIVGSFDSAIKKEGGGGVLGWIANGLASLVGFLVSSVFGFIKFSWTAFWSWCVSVKTFLYNFNWNASDKELNANINQRWQSLKARLGGALGNAFGWLACGILPGAIIFAFNEPLGAYVLKNVAEEFLEELVENFGALLRDALLLGTQIAIIETYKNVRKFIKSKSKFIEKTFGAQTADIVKAWGTEGSKPWSFAIQHEENLDKKYPNPGDREFAEEFAEEADEACVEAGYVVANSVDTWLSAEMLRKQQTPVLGNERYVEITPNRQYPENRIVIGGREEVLKPLIIQTLTNYEQMRDKDIGVIYGIPSAELPERSHRPEVVLKFYRKQNKNPNKGEIVESMEMQITFRLMNKNTADFATDAYLDVLAQAIYRELATPPFQIHKSSSTYTYVDVEHGYQFKLDVTNGQEAKRVIRKVLDIQNHRFKDELFRVGSRRSDESGQPVPRNTTPEKITIRGQIEELPVRGKSGIVKFTHAYLNPGKGLKPIVLVDLRGRGKNVVYKPT